MTAYSDAERFQSGAEKYAAYLETPEGRLRLDLRNPGRKGDSHDNSIVGRVTYTAT